MRGKIGLICCLWMFTACSYVPDSKLYTEAAKWAQAVELVTQINAQAADFAETANRLALQTNLNLQFDLGGRPETHFPSLFNRADRDIRQSLHQNLRLYANNITGALARTQTDVDPANILDFKSLKRGPLAEIKALDRLPDVQINELAEKLTGFSAYFYYPKTVKNLAELTITAQSDIDRISFLFYLDIGGIENTDESCESGKIPLKEPVNLDEFPDCRKGLRALINEALAHIIKTWRTRLKLALPKELKEAKGRPALIDRIYQMDRFKEEVDLVLLQVRSAAVELARAHQNLSLALAKSAKISVTSTRFLSLTSVTVPHGDLLHSLQELQVQFDALNLGLRALLKGEINET